jgi:predicted  nucleic acid-binding Zn-ribbon protein
MPRPKPTPLSSLTVADLKALLAEKEIEVLKERQAELEADLRRVEKELARLVKGAAVAKSAPKRAKRPASKPAAKKARKKVAAKKAPATGSIESVVVDLLKAKGAPMAVPEILATIKKQKLVKTKAANFAGVVRQTIYKSSKIKRVGRGVYRA